MEWRKENGTECCEGEEEDGWEDMSLKDKEEEEEMRVEGRFAVLRYESGRRKVARSKEVGEEDIMIPS